jgi:hypothetical protein
MVTGIKVRGIIATRPSQQNQQREILRGYRIAGSFVRAIRTANYIERLVCQFAKDSQPSYKLTAPAPKVLLADSAPKSLKRIGRLLHPTPC